MSRTIRIANGAGFWGDNLDAPVVLARSGRIDVLTLEYLAELTMSILAHLRSKDPLAGYVTDFPDLLGRLVPEWGEPPGFSILTNAGGLNPSTCAARCGAILGEKGCGEVALAVVSGDDMLGRIGDWIREGVDLKHLETGEAIETVADRLVSANAYLGARPIAEGLEQGANIVITGRVADASLTLGPACARFGWSWDDWPRLAGASVAGHLIECGAQATGGLWHAWDRIPDLAGVGYPIAEVAADGTSVITKPEGTGGVVEVGNVAEQLVYEIDDPTRYRTPDVDVDLTTVALSQAGPGRVLVRGATGRPPSEFLKVSAVYRDGWTASGMVAVVGDRAEAKARAAGRMVLDRVKRAGFELADSLVECLGAGDVVPGVLPRRGEPLEVVLRVTARDPRRAAVERFCREFAPLVTSGPPGVAGYATGRPSPRPAFGYWPALVPRALVPATLEVRTAIGWAETGGNRTEGRGQRTKE
ncbi:MAG TPA: acyclic terpene utilization AtuA family protein [Isosphaeraceae bacterium]|nr:acyclic terpene utilization AtuA family protein [Isosphaeraceae bacterium]